MLKKTIISFCLFLILAMPVISRERFFQIQSIDTMKYSRDLARQKLKDLKFQEEINAQVKNIAEVGATHVAIGTPYDEEFRPYLKRWVSAARRYGLKVWFRGNWSGWEGWFGYPKFNDREIHLEKTEFFILENPNLFEDGDIFTSCPECENGGPGDPRTTGDVTGFRNFLIEEYRLTKQSFSDIGKKVASNYFSLNGDVAQLIMDKKTVADLDEVITIDHYVNLSDRLVADVKNLVHERNARIVLGEFGAPIPDIHGNLSEQEQAGWVEDAFKKLILVPEVIGINYWTNKDSSTQLWDKDDSPREVVAVVSKYFKPLNTSGMIRDESGKPVDDVDVKGKIRKTRSKDGYYILPILDDESILFSKKGYTSVSIRAGSDGKIDISRDIILGKSQPSFFTILIRKLKEFFKL